MAEYALITGASSGIGLEFARKAASQKINLILLARNAEKLIQIRTELEGLYPVKVLAVGCDLTDHEAVDKIVSLLNRRNIVPDILINNAGFGMYGTFDRIGADNETNMIQLNISFLTELTKVIYRQMRRKGKGRILNVSSLAAFFPCPTMAVYAATKAYVLSFTEALADEAKGSGVTITALCPGPTETNFFNRASPGKGVKALQKNGKLPTPKQVAEYGWNSMMKGKTVAVHGKRSRFMIFLMRLFPRKTAVSIVGKKMRK